MTLKNTATRIGICAIAIAAAGTAMGAATATASTATTSVPPAKSASMPASGAYSSTAGTRIEFNNNSSAAITFFEGTNKSAPKPRVVQVGESIIFGGHSSTGTDIKNMSFLYGSTDQALVPWEANDPTIGKVGVSFYGTKYGVSLNQSKSATVAGHPFEVKRTESVFVGQQRTMHDVIDVYRFNLVVNLK